VDRLEDLFRYLNPLLERIQEREREELEQVRGEIGALRRQVDYLWKFAPPEELPTFHREPVPFSPPPLEGEYQALQDFFVDSEVVKQKLEVYRPYLFKKGEGSWVDAGAGRGEFLELLAEEGIEGVGVEIQLSAVEGLHRKGLKGVLSDINSYLRSSREPIGGISAIQVIEHLEWDYLEEFIELAYQRLSPGGIIILETPNPAAPRVFNNFYLDYTHKRPIPRELAAFLLLRAGFRDLEWVYSSPFHTSPRLEENYLDYGIVGWKPKEGS
jgi:O-antigen chain-terminating methyltransferase